MDKIKKRKSGFFAKLLEIAIPPTSPAESSTAIERHKNVLSIVDENDLFNKPETTEWLSQIISVAWPAVSDYAPQVFKEYIQPAVLANMPPIFPPVNFSDVKLGTVTPKIKSIRVLPENPDRPYSVALEAEVEYNGDMEVEISLGNGSSPIKFGLRDYKLYGTVEILGGPRIRTIPFFGAAQVAFINPPSLDYSLTGMAKWADAEMFRKTFRQVSEKIFNDLFVLPMRTCLPVSPGVDFLKCANDHLGVLRIGFMSGKGFANTDIMDGLPDVYLKVRLNGIEKETLKYDNSNSLKFSEEIMDFPISTTSERQVVFMQAYDWDLTSADDLLGEAKLSIKSLTEKEVTDVKLIDKLHKSDPSIKLMARYLKLSFDSSDVNKAIQDTIQDKNNRYNCSRLLLKVNIASCKNLPECEAPYVKFKVGKKIRFETGSAFHGRLGEQAFNASDPVFMMSFSAFIEEPILHDTLIEFSVDDRSKMKHIGNCTARITDLETTEFVLKDCSKDKSILRASIRLAAVMDSDPLWNYV